MFPIRDNVPCLIIPYVLRGIILINIAVFIFELLLTPQARLALFHLLGVVPARFLNPEWAVAAGYPENGTMPLFTYMFLHSSWLHIIINMWMLWIFADNIEDAMGHWRFIIFYLACGLIAIGVQMLLDPTASAPVIGASGAVAGIMGAYLMLYPHAKVLTLFPIIIIPIFLRIPAALFLGLWFALQLISGISDHFAETTQKIAWAAHIGGFIAGMIMIRFFVLKTRCVYCYVPEKKDYELPEDF
ncbi:rhomboid family intramembrane serine protease [Maridesulfovibrio zosterae]|uniref:rhomboid family intramembrane serine protease n=1 Tax=Maridesulfovibrio zosterae TaxID=82171 RepID=UPI000417C236|nr:rhomboid family intramembrane serine protease [Maridesulfovibrio zosterae]